MKLYQIFLFTIACVGLFFVIKESVKKKTIENAYDIDTTYHAPTYVFEEEPIINYEKEQEEYKYNINKKLDKIEDISSSTTVNNTNISPNIINDTSKNNIKYDVTQDNPSSNSDVIEDLNIDDKEEQTIQEDMLYKEPVIDTTGKDTKQIVIKRKTKFIIFKKKK